MAAVRPLFLLIYLFFLTPGSNSAGYYGCKYSTSVCDQDEICVDDSWFGQCWSPFSADTPSEILLSDEQLDRLNRLLLSLISHGFTWNDLYSQCTIQKALDASDDVEDTEIVEYCQEATMVELNNEVAVLEGMIDEEIDELSQKEEELSPMEVIHFLNDLFSFFDAIIEQHDVYKVETIGDGYMVVSGVPKRNENRHVAEIVNMALDILSDIFLFRVRGMPDIRVQVRIGVHTGSCVAGVIGSVMPRYCLFGDTINTASRMESNGKGLCIHLSETSYIALKAIGGYEMLYRGQIQVKGKGMQHTYWLIGKDGYLKPLPDMETLVYD